MHPQINTVGMMPDVRGQSGAGTTLLSGERHAPDGSNPVRFATDKVQHGYLGTYLRIAAGLGPAARVCEVGAGHGHGLDMLQAC